MNNLYVFIDISGDFEFNDSGSKYLIITSLTCTDVMYGVVEAYMCKRDLNCQNHDFDYYHACDNNVTIRNNFFDIISRMPNIRIDSVIAEKRKAYSAVRPKSKLYPMLFEQLLKYPFDPKGVNAKTFNQVVIYADKETVSRKQKKEITETIKQSLKAHLDDVPFQFFMHTSASHLYLQIVDYCSWSLFRKWESNDDSWYRKLNGIYDIVKSEWPLFQTGTEIYY